MSVISQIIILLGFGTIFICLLCLVGFLLFTVYEEVQYRKKRRLIESDERGHKTSKQDQEE